MRFARVPGMPKRVKTPLTHRIAQFGAVRLARRLGLSAPIIGTVVALVAARAAVRRKGMLGGTIDTALNAIPLVGTVKNVVEMARGGDFIPDRLPAEGSARPIAPPVPPPPPRRTLGERARNIKL
jgi:hypothetical protein